MLLLLSNWRAIAVSFQHLQDCAILEREQASLVLLMRCCRSTLWS